MADDKDKLDDAWAFTKSAGKGAVDAGTEIVEGVSELAKSGYKIATEAEAREAAWEATKETAGKVSDYGEAVIDDPEKIYRDARDVTMEAYDSYKKEEATAEKEGKLPEFYGEMAGGGAVEVGSILIPAGAAAKVGKLGKVAKAGDDLGSANKAKGALGGSAAKELDEAVSPVQKCPVEEVKNTDAAKNPLPGLHNRDDLTLGKQDKFKTIRKIDMDNLSEADEIAAKALKDQGWEKGKIKEILSSGDSFRVKDLKKGDKLYGIGTEGYSKDIKTSSYWLDEAGYNKVKDKFYKDGHWDKEGVKNNLALPCFNKANNVDQAVLTESHTVVESTIGKATELIQYKGDDGYSTGLLGKIMGGGGTQIANDPTKIKSIP